MISASKLLLSVVLILSGLSKISDPALLSASIASFQLVPQELIPLISLWLPTFEILVGVLLAIKPLEGGALAASTLLFSSFAAAYGYALYANIVPSCSCFGENPFLAVDPQFGCYRACALALLSLGAWALSQQNRLISQKSVLEAPPHSRFLGLSN